MLHKANYTFLVRKVKENIKQTDSEMSNRQFQKCKIDSFRNGGRKKRILKECKKRSKENAVIKP